MSGTDPRLPGITVDYVFPTPEPAFLTGVPLFIEDFPGPMPGEPAPLTLWPQYLERYQRYGLLAGNLAPAVRGFFENGGRLCYLIFQDQSLSDPVVRLRAALAASEVLEEVDLVCAPSIAGSPETPATPESLQLTTRLQAELLDHCQRLGTRFAILDPLCRADVSLLQRQRQELHGDYGALYHTWLVTAAFGTGGEGETVKVPPCGHIAGLYAYCDESNGVYQAPANVELEGALDLSFNPGPADLSELYASSINPIVARPGRGIRLWGARTLSADEDWQAINVRRLFITLRRRLEQIMLPLSFEPNDVRLWIRMNRQLTAYLEDLYRQGALKGARPEQAFYVKCDGETNPSEVIDAGQVVAQVGLAPAVPNEFIEVRIVQGPAGVSISTA
jgi:phage tail sheath protein FI